MNGTVKILLPGVAVAAGLAAFCAISNYISTARHEQNVVSLERTIAALQAKCVAKGQENTKLGEPWGHDPLVCDPKALASLPGPFIGIQEELAAKQSEINVEQQDYRMQLPYLVSLVIFVIAVLPWTWYFLLRRIRELSDAIRGR